jgi:hypothetical protein
MLAVGVESIRNGSTSILTLNVKILLIDASSRESIKQANQQIQNKYGDYVDVLESFV